MWWRSVNRVSHGKDFASLEHAWFNSSRRMTSPGLLALQLDSKPNCSFVLPEKLRGGFSTNSYRFLWSCHQIVCSLSRDYCFLICSPKVRLLFNFLSYMDRAKLNKGRRWGKSASERENWSEHDVRTCSVRHSEVYIFNPYPLLFSCFEEKTQSIWCWLFIIAL